MVRGRAGALAAVMVVAGLAGCSRNGDNDCSGLDAYRELNGQRVRLLVPAEQVDPLRSAVKPFTTCTGATVTISKPTGGHSVDTTVERRTANGKQPDVALVTHAEMRTLAARRNGLQTVPTTVSDQMQENFAGLWTPLMSQGGKAYGVPVDLELKSLIWYSPGMLRAKGQQIPQTWQDLRSMTAKLAGSDEAGGVKPWCDGFVSAGGTSGWPGTDWIEDVVLRTAGTGTFDKWVNHQISFDDPRIVAATSQVSGILRNNRYTNGGLGGPSSIAETPFKDAGGSILSGECYLHREGSRAYWRTGTRVSPNGDVWAFPMPATSGARTKPLLVTGDIAVGFNQSRATQALQTYFATTRFARARAAADGSGGWVSANRNLDDDRLPVDLDRQVSAWLKQDDVEIRFDGSDDMPRAIARGAFWNAVMSWIQDQGMSSEAMLAKVDSAWPK